MSDSEDCGFELVDDGTPAGKAKIVGEERPPTTKGARIATGYRFGKVGKMKGVKASLFVHAEDDGQCLFTLRIKRGEELLGQITAEPTPDGRPNLVTYWEGQKQIRDASDQFASMIGFRRKAVPLACELLGVDPGAAERVG